MRIEINTPRPVKDNDVRALYLLDKAMRISTPRMRNANLSFIWDRLLNGKYSPEMNKGVESSRTTKPVA